MATVHQAGTCSAAGSVRGEELERARGEQLTAASHLMESTIRGGASRQVAAAVAAALLRALDQGIRHGEVEARLSHIRPVIEAKVAAGGGHAVHLTGSTRAARNVAEHNFSEPIAELVKDARRAQRGGSARRSSAIELRQEEPVGEPAGPQRSDGRAAFGTRVAGVHKAAKSQVEPQTSHEKSEGLEDSHLQAEVVLFQSNTSSRATMPW
jgi:hypothetical protein